MTVLLKYKALAILSIIFHGSIFGFFYAWICSTMWGLDTLAPIDAIKAMNGMNSTVQNAVFMPAFFITPIVSLVAGITLYNTANQRAGLFLIAASAIYFFGALLVTATVNVPMNRQLLTTDLTQSSEQLKIIWQQYSSKWQVYNTTRTLFSMLALLSATVGLAFIEPK